MQKILLFVCSLAGGIALAAQSPCETVAHAQFDFWLGEWTVYHSEADTLVGHNTITRILHGCVLEEHWRSASGFEGKSFNTYDPESGTWNQLWVDQAGNAFQFTGKLINGNMVMTGETRQNGKDILFQLSYHPQDDGGVRQVWKSSNDGGETWTVLFDGRYRRS